MNRTGLTGSILVVFIISGWLIVGLESGVYEDIVEQQIQPQVRDIYTRNVVGEDVLTAPCATEARGVFHRSAVVSGRFDCLAMRGTVVLEFSVGEDTYAWRVTDTDDGATVEALGGSAGFTHSAPILVHDETTGVFERGTVRIGVEQ